jgi:hypothetical protein
MTKLWALLALLALLTAGTYYEAKDKQAGEVSAKDDGNVPPPWP